MACARFRKPMHPRMNTIKAISTLAVLLASMVVVGWAAEPPPSGDYNSIELVHVDAHRGFSSDELMRRAANRSRLRAATMYPEASAASGPLLPPSTRSPGGFCFDLAEYFMKFYFAGTNDATSAMMDTGSDIIWTTKEECGKFNEKELLRCDDHMCKPHANCGCDSEGACQYDITYGDSNAGKAVKGHMYKGKLSFLLPSEPGSDSSETSYSAPMDVALGCSTVEHFQRCSSPPMTGLVGLGRGDQSLPKQLKVKNFSYCLNKYTNPDLKSILLFNNPAPDLAKGKRKKGAAKVVTTPLFRHPDEAWYFVDLKDISIGGTSLLIPAVHPQKEAGGNMFIDSGASYTNLQEGAFEKVVKELDRIMEEKKMGKQERDDMNCYSGKPDASMPKMELHFANSAVMELPWESYLWHQENGEKSSMCLAIKKKPNGTKYHVLGNFQQQSMHMHFDIENEELKFVQADCSKVH